VEKTNIQERKKDRKRRRSKKKRQKRRARDAVFSARMNGLAGSSRFGGDSNFCGAIIGWRVGHVTYEDILVGTLLLLPVLENPWLWFECDVRNFTENDGRGENLE
jgi:hypothetical protein